MNERCHHHHCTKPIHFSDKFGIYAWRHDASSNEFCTEVDSNPLDRATPDGSEYR